MLTVIARVSLMLFSFVAIISSYNRNRTGSNVVNLRFLNTLVTYL